MSSISIKDVAMIYPFTKVTGLFNRKQKQLALEKQKQMPYTTNEGVVALQHFSLEIEDGEFVVLLGPSGSGKSTLLRILAGLERPSVGDVLFDGASVVDVKSEDRDVAMVFQNYSLYPNKTVYENICFPLENLHMERGEIEERVNEISELLHLKGKLSKLPHELSGGEKQRVAIARALVRKPKVFLLDEPFSNLDVLLRNELRNELKRIQKELQMTFVYVTHEQSEALYLADKLVVMNNGKIIQAGEVVDLYNHPVNEFVASFIGFVPMNIYKGIEVSGDKSISLLNQKFILKGIKDKTVDIGIRPTDVELIKHGITALIEYSEIVGADRLIHLRVNDNDVLAVEKVLNADVNPWSDGEMVDLKIAEENLYIFNQNEELIR